MLVILGILGILVIIWFLYNRFKQNLTSTKPTSSGPPAPVKIETPPTEDVLKDANAKVDARKEMDAKVIDEKVPIKVDKKTVSKESKGGRIHINRNF